MAYYNITAFDGTTLSTYHAYQVDMTETAVVISRVTYLENGAKFDADGTTDGDVTPGQVVARFEIVPASAGTVALNTDVAALTALRNKHGTLTGGADATTKTCTARCTDVIQEDYSSGGMPMATARRSRVYVNMIFEKLTEWA